MGPSRLNFRRKITQDSLELKALAPRDADITSQTLSFTPKWKTTVRLGGWAVAITLILNVALFIYSGVNRSTGAPALSSFAPILYGACDDASKLKLGLDFGVNILSTILLSASAVTMQILSAPTRKEIDKAHSIGKWLDIGTLSARNLWSKPQLHRWLWVLLALSSVPLHLLYNSVVFLSSGSNDVLSLLVTGDIASSTPWNDTLKQDIANTAYKTGQISYTICETQQHHNGFFCGEEAEPQDVRMALDDLQTSLAENRLIQLDMQDCNNTFQLSTSQGYSAVMLVTNMTASNYNDNSMLGYSWTSAVTPPKWTDFGHGPYYNSSTFMLGPGRRPHWVETAFSEITIPDGPFDIQYCLAQPSPQLCSVQVSQVLLGVVIAANLAKLLVIIYVAKFLNIHPLVTVGDAIADFMSNPDPTTKGVGPISGNDIRRRIWSKKQPQTPHEKQWHNEKRFWYAAGSVPRWITLITLYIIMIVGLGVAAFVETSAGQSGFGTASPTELGTASPTKSFVNGHSTGTAIIVANAPQVVISVSYILLNGMITCMLLSSEFMDFARAAKPLRVSSDVRGEQLSKYFLQIPLRYVVPLLVLMAGLHWAVSQSIFLIQIDTYTVSQRVGQAALISTVGYSHRAIVVTFSLVAFISTIPLVLGLRRYPSGIPLVSHYSLGISAACHPTKSEPLEATEKRIMYGVLDELGTTGRRRVGFSSQYVDHLKDGEIYDRSKCVEALLKPGERLECCGY